MKRGINVGYQRRGGGEQQDLTTMDAIDKEEAISVSQNSSSSATKKRGRDWSLISRQKQQRLTKSHGTAL